MRRSPTTGWCSGHRERFAPAELAELLEGYAVECYTVGATEAPIVESEAVELRRSLGDQRALGADLRWLSRMQYWAGDRAAAERSGAEAIAVLEAAGDRRLLALALSNQAQLHMLAFRATDCVAVGERAVALARELGDAAILSHALLNVGSARWQLGDPVAWSLMEESLRVALAAGEVEHACRAYIVIAWYHLDDLRLDDAERNLAEGIGLAERHDHLGYLGYLNAELGKLKVARAEWDDAVRAARQGLDGAPLVRHGALTVLGRVRARRGEPGGDELLREAWELAVELRELQRSGPTAGARAEAAWLAGDHAAVRAIAGPVYEEARRLGYAPLQAELGYWLTKAGQAVPPLASEHPYALQAAGRWREAAAAWQAAGYPYEHAAALAESPDPQDRLAALAELDALGAAPLARLVRAGLRRLGVAHVPRGPVGATRQNPAGLTERQVQVLGLLSQGCTNAEIADRLVVSTRTVDSHVAAVLAKLGVGTRRAAAATGGRPRCPRPGSSVAAGADLGSGHGSARIRRVVEPQGQPTGADRAGVEGRRAYRRSELSRLGVAGRTCGRQMTMPKSTDPTFYRSPGRGDRGPARAAGLRRRLRPRRQGQGRHGGDRLRPGRRPTYGQRGRLERAAHRRQRAAPLRLERLLQRAVPPGPRRPRPAAGAPLPDRPRHPLLPHLCAGHQARPPQPPGRPGDHGRGAGRQGRLLAAPYRPLRARRHLHVQPGRGQRQRRPRRGRPARPRHLRRHRRLGARPRRPVLRLRRLVAPRPRHRHHLRVGHPVDDRERPEPRGPARAAGSGIT